MCAWKYDLYMDLTGSGDEYHGEEKITVDRKEKNFYLNAVDMKINQVLLNAKELEFDYDSKEGILKLPKKVKPGAVIEIKFEGRISKSLMGLYRVKTNNGFALTTQFEPNGARMAFPCRDEPGTKATFDLRVLIPVDYEAISNMPVATSREVSGQKEVVFQQTPVMSTYLLYIGVGKYASVSDRSKKPEIIMSYPGSQLSAEPFSLEEARKAVDYYEEYYGIKFALPKMHLLGIPEFGAGAMENWGAITFREVVLFVQKDSGQKMRKYVSMVEAHEIAHQWFGDLVTMKWWNDLWLNESFATFMSYKCVDSFHKEFDMWGDFLTSEYAGAMAGDSLKSSHPINADVKSPDEIAQIFDEISYGKGGSVLRMIEGYVGEENFRKGISSYLKKFPYGNAENADLWNAIQEVSGIPVSMIMSQWINRPGYPYIRVTRKGDSYLLSQERFYLSGSPGNEIWPVPIFIRGTSSSTSILMNAPQIEVDARDVISLNRDALGFYRVLYDPSVINSLQENISRMNHLEKWSIINDFYAFLRAGKTTVKDYIETLSRFIGESNYLVVDAISSQLDRMVYIDPGNQAIRDFSSKYHHSALEAIGEKVEDENVNISILRGDLRERLSRIDPAFASSIAVDFNNFFKTPGDIRGSVAVAYAEASNNFSGLRETFLKAETDEDRMFLLNGLGSLKGKDNFESVWAMINSGEIKMQDTIRLIYVLVANTDTRPLMFERFEETLKMVREIFQGTGYASFAVESAIPLMGLVDREGIIAMVEKHMGPDIVNGFNKGKEYLEINLRLRDMLKDFKE
ncbi:MAG: M1 family metallopeptidase [Candidatus Thermoplasmatota archaeon]|nr:M1 family metallopeptidase [Candidatus Thermoplasmatota archaeon]